MNITLKSTIRDVYKNLVGRDIVNKLLMQLGKPTWLIDNPIVGSVSLGFVKRLTQKKIGSGFIETIIDLLNSEPDTPSTKPVEASPAWWKEAVFYQIYPRSFSGENGKGVLREIKNKLDYFCDLGIDALWLSPVYDSPNDDNGYDIRDYFKILPEFGSMDDMDELIDGLHKRGMKLIMDLVVNHTSDEHQWFHSALHDENSSYRNYYFFTKPNSEDSRKNPPNNWKSFFGGSAWNYYEEQDVWALHIFSKKQMDLNWECPALRDDIYKMVKWWLEKGVDGFRLDVINYISKNAAKNGAGKSFLPDGDSFIGELMGYTGIERYFYGSHLHEFLRELHAEAFEPHKAFSVGETPGVGIQMGRLLTDSYRKELDLIFSFDHLETPGHSRFDDYRYDLSYLKQFYVERLNTDLGHGWNTLFFNNHDNPRMVSKIDPEGLYTEPLAKLLAVLQMTLRGTPFVYQGDETGTVNETFNSIDEIKDVESLGLYADLIKTMPPEAAFKKIIAGTRDHARSPMRWDEVEKQRLSKSSVWKFYKELIALRRSSKALIYGELNFLHTKNKKMLIYTRNLPGSSFYIEANITTSMLRSKAPKKAALVICNYGEDTDKTLRPYEARVYRLGH